MDYRLVPDPSPEGQYQSERNTFLLSYSAVTRCLFIRGRSAPAGKSPPYSLRLQTRRLSLRSCVFFGPCRSEIRLPSVSNTRDLTVSIPPFPDLLSPGVKPSAEHLSRFSSRTTLFPRIGPIFLFIIISGVSSYYKGCFLLLFFSPFFLFSIGVLQSDDRSFGRKL